jgi:low affinity Fe/Cu permease
MTLFTYRCGYTHQTTIAEHPDEAIKTEKACNVFPITQRIKGKIRICGVLLLCILCPVILTTCAKAETTYPFDENVEYVLMEPIDENTLSLEERVLANLQEFLQTSINSLDEVKDSLVTIENYQTNEVSAYVKIYLNPDQALNPERESIVKRFVKNSVINLPEDRIFITTATSP